MRIKQIVQLEWERENRRREWETLPKRELKVNELQSGNGELRRDVETSEGLVGALMPMLFVRRKHAGPFHPRCFSHTLITPAIQ